MPEDSEDSARTALLIETLRLVAEGEDGKDSGDPATEAAGMRARASFELIAVMSYLEGKGVPFSLLVGLQNLKIALADLQRGARPEMFVPPEGGSSRPPESLGRLILWATAAASVTLLRSSGAYSKPAACKHVVSLLESRGNPIEPKMLRRDETPQRRATRRLSPAEALSRFRDRIRSNKAAQETKKPQKGRVTSIAFAMGIHDLVVQHGNEWFVGPAKALGHSDKEAAEIAAEQVLGRVALSQDVKPSATLQNIQRRFQARGKRH